METTQLQLREPELLTDQTGQMDILSNEISPVIFKRIIRSDPGEFTLDSQMFRVVRELDGRKTAGAVADSIGMDIETLGKTVQRLLDVGVIAPTDGAGSVLQNGFLSYLTEQLSMAVGPVAQGLIEDAVTGMGLDRDRVPIHKARDLVNLLAKRIYGEEKKLVFKENLNDRILKEEDQR